jgi:colicin import membrane protein
MPAFASEHARPLLGAAALHVVLFALLAAAALNWRSQQPTVPLAIEGTVVQYKDLPPSLQTGHKASAPRPVPPAPRPVAQPAPAPEPQVEDQAARERARAAVAQRHRDEQAAQDKLRQEQDREAAAQQRKADVAAKARAADEARRKAAEAETAQQQAAKEKAAQDARLKAAREADLKRALAAEEEGAAVAQSGVTDEYRALLVQAIERNWIRPPSARAGLECTLNVTQATGGTVVDVAIGNCNGDEAVRDSITNAVYKSSPLPAPRDPRAFERRLVIVFKPTE